MQIVINIHKEKYREVKQMMGFLKEHKCPISAISWTYEAIANGKPLPKGHGRLIDASSLITITDVKTDGSEFTYVPYSQIEDAPTVIEADERMDE